MLAFITDVAIHTWARKYPASPYRTLLAATTAGGLIAYELCFASPIGPQVAYRLTTVDLVARQLND